MVAMTLVTEALLKIVNGDIFPKLHLLARISGSGVIIHNTRRVRMLMSDSYPYMDELSILARRVVPG